MKLALSLFVFGVFITSSTFAAQVSVTIDGVSYSCAQGGSGGGNQCECSFEKSVGEYYRWFATKKGNQIKSVLSSNRKEAADECRLFISTESRCYN